MFSPSWRSAPPAVASKASAIRSPRGNVASVWKRLRDRAGVSGFRFHDFRHNLATKLLRDTGNLKLVQKALNHADVKTTVRYAHVLDDEVAEALERVTQSRNKSRSKLRDVG
jgi:integrase